MCACVKSWYFLRISSKNTNEYEYSIKLCLTKQHLMQLLFPLWCNNKMKMIRRTRMIEWSSADWLYNLDTPHDAFCNSVVWMAWDLRAGTSSSVRYETISKNRASTSNTGTLHTVKTLILGTSVSLPTTSDIMLTLLRLLCRTRVIMCDMSTKTRLRKVAPL